MNKHDLMYQARVSAEVLREVYGVPVHRATVLEDVARGAAQRLEDQGVEVTDMYVTNELVAGDELGIRIETNMMVIDIQAYPKTMDKDTVESIVKGLNEKYGSPEGLRQAIANDYKEIS